MAQNNQQATSKSQKITVASLLMLFQQWQKSNIHRGQNAYTAARNAANDVWDRYSNDVPQSERDGLHQQLDIRVKMCRPPVATKKWIAQQMHGKRPQEARRLITQIINMLEDDERINDEQFGILREYTKSFLPPFTKADIDQRFAQASPEQRLDYAGKIVHIVCTDQRLNREMQQPLLDHVIAFLATFVGRAMARQVVESKVAEIGETETAQTNATQKDASTNSEHPQRKQNGRRKNRRNGKRHSGSKAPSAPTDKAEASQDVDSDAAGAVADTLPPTTMPVIQAAMTQ